MEFLDRILGLGTIKKRLDEVEERISRVENLVEEEYQPVEKFKSKILEILSKEPKTTEEIAIELGKSRSWTSYVLNQMERKGDVKEIGRKGRKLQYVKRGSFF
jgi:predicted HTH transcriptional regulator